MKLNLANKIIRSEEFQALVDQLHELEKDRKFCGHDMDHFLAVARVALIMCYEKGIEADADILYSAALLHDLGRIEEYTEGVPHDVAGVRIAEDILDKIGCLGEKRARILSLIAAHRSSGSDKESLEYIFYLADKRSRQCFNCAAAEECNWDMNKRNNEIRE